MYQAITPAQPAWLASGALYAPDYEETYYRHTAAIKDAEQTFLTGCGLPERWRGHSQFCVLELGFGLGLNFLATWHAWEKDPCRAERLHYVALELHPFSKESMARLHAHLLRDLPKHKRLAMELYERWPALTSGLHRLHLAQGRVTLTLWFGDALAGLKQIQAHVDAFYLDGFSPERNPAMWSPGLLYQVARLSNPGTMLSIWVKHPQVQKNLAHMRFQALSSVLEGAENSAQRFVYAGRSTPNKPQPCKTEAWVIGAGLAGNSVAERLCARGWQVRLFEGCARYGLGASGNHAGILRYLPSVDDNAISRLTRAGSQYAIRHLNELASSGIAQNWAASGVLHITQDKARQVHMERVVRTLALPQEILRYVDQAEASDLAGVDVAGGGWWFASAGWAQPCHVCSANIRASHRLTVIVETSVARLEFDGENWQGWTQEGAYLGMTPVVVLANGVGMNCFDQARALPIFAGRGQTSLLSEQTPKALKAAVMGAAYICPAAEGQHCVGASFNVEKVGALALRKQDQESNFLNLGQTLPGYAESALAVKNELSGHVGYRPLSPDRVPIVGRIPLGEAVQRYQDQSALQKLPRPPGCMSSMAWGHED